jgi:hypothetical protein
MAPMKRVVLTATTLLLTACSASSSPSALETPFQVSVVVHCGVGWQTIEYEGSMYRMQARNEAETVNPPRGWSDPVVITVIEDDGRLLAIAPDGSERELIPVSPEETPSGGCL